MKLSLVMIIKILFSLKSCLFLGNSAFVYVEH